MDDKALRALLLDGPDIAARKLAAMSVFVRSQRSAEAKTAGVDIGKLLGDAGAAAKPYVDSAVSGIKNLNLADPLTAGALGAGAMGVGSLASEALQPKERRRWGNVLLNAALGGALGAAAPTAVRGLREFLTPTPATATPPTAPQVASDAVGSATAPVARILRKVVDGLSPTDTRNALPRMAVGAAADTAALADQNRLMAAGVAAAPVTWLAADRINKANAIARGLSPGAAPDTQAAAFARAYNGAPTPAQHETLDAYLNRGAATRAASAGRVLRHGLTGAATPAERIEAILGINDPARYGHIPPQTFQRAYRAGGGPLTARGVISRTGVSAAPALLGGFLDYLARQPNQ